MMSSAQVELHFDLIQFLSGMFSCQLEWYLTSLCFNINTYYFHFNITNRNWDCKCGDATPPNPAVVREHILHLCPLYAKSLSPASRLHEPMTLLGSDKGLLAMVNFCKSTSALTINGRPYFPTNLLFIPSEVDIADITGKYLPD